MTFPRNQADVRGDGGYRDLISLGFEDALRDGDLRFERLIGVARSVPCVPEVPTASDPAVTRGEA